MAFSRLDLPTFERPKNATSGIIECSNPSIAATPLIKLHLFEKRSFLFFKGLFFLSMPFIFQSVASAIFFSKTFKKSNIHSLFFHNISLLHN